MVDDTISRQAAIRWVKTECNPYGKPTLDFESGKKVIEHLEQMPSAERRGRWIDITKCGGCSVFKCSECGDLQLEESYYCPNCGARMEAE